MTRPHTSARQAAVLNYTCEDCLPRLYEFIDNELSIEELQAMQDHLDGCDNCTYEHEVRTRLKDVVHDKCFEPAPPGLRERVVASIAKQQANKTTIAGS